MRKVNNERRRWGPGHLGGDFVFLRGKVGKPEPGSRDKGKCKRDSAGGRNNRM